MTRFPLYPWLAAFGLWFGVSSAHGRICRTWTGGSSYRSYRVKAGASAEEASCRRFVGEFYAWYVAQSKHGEPLLAALRRRKSNFSPELIRRLSEDREAAARNPNEIVGLDFDPVLNAQDFASRYLTGRVTHTGRRYRVEVYGVWSGKRTEIPEVTPELRREGGRWVFTNFLYRQDKKSDDLLSLLTRLKTDRQKRS